MIPASLLLGGLPAMNTPAWRLYVMYATSLRAARASRSYVVPLSVSSHRLRPVSCLLTAKASWSRQMDNSHRYQRDVSATRASESGLVTCHPRSSMSALQWHTGLPGSINMGWQHASFKSQTVVNRTALQDVKFHISPGALSRPPSLCLETYRSVK